MKRHIPILSLAALAFTAAIAAVPALAATGDEQKLNTEQQGIDQSAKAGAPRVETLAAEFGVTTDQVSALRAKQGWGSVTVELAMAQQLMKADATLYPDMTAALAKVESMRAQGFGWGRIAKDLGFKLGPVVSSVQHARHEVMKPVRAERTASAERPERIEKAERPDRPHRPDRPQRPERPARH